jgi:hypothetical protein
VPLVRPSRTSSRLRDLALQPERRAPHDGLVGRIEPGQAGAIDDLLHRSRLRHRLLERSPVGRQHRPDHRPGHRHGWHRPRDDDDHDSSRDGAPADQGQPGGRDVEPRYDRDGPGDEGEPAANRPACDDLARPLREPALGHEVVLEHLVEREDGRAELREVLRADEVVRQPSTDRG